MENEKPPFKTILFRTEEGRVLIGFFLFALLLLGLIGFFFLTNPAIGRTLTKSLILNSFGGRAAGVGFCLDGHLSFAVTVWYNTLLELVNVCLMYSVFVLSFNHYLHFKWFDKLNHNLETAARKYEKKISVYGWIGLFFFVMIPLPITGPVVGSIIGYFLKMRVWKNFSAVVSGSILSIILWTEFFEILMKYQKLFQYAIIIILVAVALSCFKLIKSFYKQFIQGKISES